MSNKKKAYFNIFLIVVACLAWTGIAVLYIDAFLKMNRLSSITNQQVEDNKKHGGK